MLCFGYLSLPHSVKIAVPQVDPVISSNIFKPLEIVTSLRELIFESALTRSIPATIETLTLNGSSCPGSEESQVRLAVPVPYIGYHLRLVSLKVTRSSQNPTLVVRRLEDWSKSVTNDGIGNFRVSAS